MSEDTIITVMANSRARNVSNFRCSGKVGEATMKVSALGR